MNNTSKIIIIILSAATVAAIIAGLSIHVFRNNSVVLGGSKTVTDTVEPEGELKEIIIDTDYANVSVSRGDKLSVSYSLPEKLVPKVDLSNGRLTIESPKNNISILPFGARQNYYISLTLPKDTESDRVTVELDAGNLNIDGLNSKSVAIEVDAGNVNLNNCSAEKLGVELDAGNLEMTGCTIHSINAELDAGNLLAKDCVIENGSCETDIGNIDLSGEIGNVITKTSLGKTSVNNR